MLSCVVRKGSLDLKVLTFSLLHSVLVHSEVHLVDNREERGLLRGRQGD